MFYRTCGTRVRVALAAVLTVAIVSLAAPAPASAQSDPNPAALTLTNAFKAQPPSGPSVVAAFAEGEGAQQPATGDSGVLNFFRKTELAGFADMYFHYNFNKPATGSFTPLRNFDSQHNQFSFALAELAFIKPATSDDRVGFRLDLDYGPVADAVNAFEPAGDVFRNIQQGYISYMAPVGTGLTIDIGKFVTQHGAEVIEAKDNWNYSRSFLFALAIPYYHMGVRLGYAPNDRVTLGGYVVNGWNNATDNNSGKTYGLQAILKPTGSMSIVQNYMGGPEQTDNPDDWRHLSDTTLTYTVNDMFSVMGNYDYGHDSGSDQTWQGLGLYAKAQVNPNFALIPRIEFLDDKDGFMSGAAQKLKEFTLTAEVKHTQGLIMRVEYRRDWSDVDFFVDGDGPRPNENTFSALRANQNTFSVGFIYAFSSKAP